MTAVAQRIGRWLRGNIVLTVALAAAAVTCCFVPPDAGYLAYFDLKTLTCLFCMLAVVGALRNIGLFQTLARHVVALCQTTRTCILALVGVTFVGSMLMTNDMALLTFLPLASALLGATGRTPLLAFTFVMQTIAANLGGMITPFGSPQNLFLFTWFNIPLDEFALIMLPPFVVSLVLIAICCCVFTHSEPLQWADKPVELNKRRAVVCLALFIVAIAVVFRWIPYLVGLGLVVVALLIVDRSALAHVDYALFLTFIAFFVFAGNMARIGAVESFFESLLAQSTLLASVFSSQIISNVPTAILLAQFTTDYPALLVGVNIGGVGTLIASLASLIAYREYAKQLPNKQKHFLSVFSLFNFGFLVVLVTFCLIV